MMSVPHGYHLTWTTYGTWLPGDQRGWIKDGTPGIQKPDEDARGHADRRLVHLPVVLNTAQRQTVEATIREVCSYRHWTIHALNVRTNHIHLVVTADQHPDLVMNQLKTWCSRRLNQSEASPLTPASQRQKWWTLHGSTKWLFEQEYFENAIHYVANMQ